MVKYLYGMLGIVVSCPRGDLEFYITYGLFLWICVIYKALGDSLRMEFSRAFLEWWLRMTSLELWLGMTSFKLWLEMKDEHWTFLEL